MVCHVVLWKVREGTDPDEVLATMQELFKSFEDKVTGLIRLSLHRGFAGHDICLISEHESRQALDAYQNCPEHVAAKGYIQSVTQERTFSDFEV